MKNKLALKMKSFLVLAAMFVAPIANAETRGDYTYINPTGKWSYNQIPSLAALQTFLFDFLPTFDFAGTTTTSYVGGLVSNASGTAKRTLNQMTLLLTSDSATAFNNLTVCPKTFKLKIWSSHQATAMNPNSGDRYNLDIPLQANAMRNVGLVGGSIPVWLVYVPIPLGIEVSNGMVVGWAIRNTAACGVTYTFLSNQTIENAAMNLWISSQLNPQALPLGPNAYLTANMTGYIYETKDSDQLAKGSESTLSSPTDSTPYVIGK